MARGVRWYAAAILIPLGIALATGGLNVALGASDSAFAKLELSALVLMFAMRLVVPVFAPIGEEPGWRGFALRGCKRSTPRSCRRSSSASSSPSGTCRSSSSPRSTSRRPSSLATVAVTFFYTWIFNHTRGSVFMTIVAHAAEGVIAGAFIGGTDGFRGAGETRFALLYSVAWCVVALVLVVFDRGMWRTPVRVRVTADGTLEDSRVLPALTQSREGPGKRAVRTVMVTTTRHDKGASP